VKFEDYAREAGEALAESGKRIQLPSLDEMSARRRRAGLVWGVVGLAAVAVGAIFLAGSLLDPDPVPPAATLATTVPENVAVEPLIVDLLDGTQLEVRGAFDFSLSGYFFFLEIPELGGEKSVDVSPTIDPSSDGDLCADLGAGVQLWCADREGQPIFMSIDLGGWLVYLHVGWGTPPDSEFLVALADELRGQVTDNGVIIPGANLDMFRTYLAWQGGEGSIDIDVGQCIREVVPGAEVVSHPLRGDVIRADGYASWCEPDNDLEVRLHLPENMVDQLLDDLSLERTAPSPPPTSTTIVETPDGSLILPISLDEPVALKVLAVRPNNPSLAVIDLFERTTTVYPPGVHALPLDSTDGAVSTPDRNWIIWTNGVARLLTDSLDRVDVVLGPSPPREITGYAPALRVIPTPDGDRAWLVQPGITSGTDNYPTLVDLVDVDDASILLSVEADRASFPVGATDTGLVLNVHEWFDTGDGFVTEPGTEFTFHLLEDGTTIPIGEGVAIAASPTRVVRLACEPDPTGCDPYGRANRLLISAPDGSGEIEVAKPFDGTWLNIGGPMIPSDAMPFQTTSPDGSEMLVSLGADLDPNHVPSQSALVAVNLADGSVRTIAEVEGRTPFATWSSDGEWIALLWRQDITLINSANPQLRVDLEGVVPEDHWPLAAG
jgi:hypothetical protein